MSAPEEPTRVWEIDFGFEVDHPNHMNRAELWSNGNLVLTSATDDVVVLNREDWDRLLEKRKEYGLGRAD